MICKCFPTDQAHFQCACDPLISENTFVACFAIFLVVLFILVIFNICAKSVLRNRFERILLA